MKVRRGITMLALALIAVFSMTLPARAGPVPTEKSVLVAAIDVAADDGYAAGP
jgi:hypothetical protein